MKPARTRFAPSPTGYLHVGGIRTALFAWLIARQTGGQFILRLEDTDQAREVQGADEHIMESLRWCGLEWDEGPDGQGQYGPYRQSERLAIYKQWGQQLIETGRAYVDPYSQEELDAFRSQAKAEKRPFLFRAHRPDNPPLWDGTQPLRFKSEPKAYQWHDAVMGDLSAGPEAIDDFILIKGDGFPTYNFCHIIDDHLMQITHVIRSQEFLASVPKYLNLYEALGIDRPVLATLPFVMGSDGKKKLSKRDGAKDALDYARDGYLPEAMRNFLATLGWNDGTEQELFTTRELIEKFSLERVQKSGAAFDERRLLWMNGAHIRQLPLSELAEKVATYWPESAVSASEAYKLKVLGLVQERLKYFGELGELSKFFFEDLPIDLTLISENKQLKKLSHEEAVDLLHKARTALEQADFNAETLQALLNQLLETTGQKPGVLFGLIRVATTHSPASPGLAETLETLGKETALRRINATLAAL